MVIFKITHFSCAIFPRRVEKELIVVKFGTSVPSLINVDLFLKVEQQQQHIIDVFFSKFLSTDEFTQSLQYIVNCNRYYGIHILLSLCP